MKLTILTENVAGGICAAEHGLSYLIEYDKQKILFDVGHSNIFLQNAKLLNINIDEVKTVVLSHGHWDHGNGLKYLKDKTLICHSGAFIKRYRKGGTENIGLEETFNELKNRFKIIKLIEPYLISDKIIYLGEIPRHNSFESQTTTFVDENRNDDFVLDDSALAVTVGNELVVISACSHSGICNIVEHAKLVTGIEKVKAVFGGFHLKENNYQTKETINYFKKNNINEIHPSHCTELPALVEFYNVFKIKQVKTGMVFHL
ncbi:MAG: MBL fold metallo-hydrolase [Bacteroidetes bacterium]|nr:MBL fold metallo-hydrolase [Bacteroidota bacterium]MBU1115897.1 MBL fold metallo-hydrolase [Bacteroidota bacterium]MBU1798744.1 MBL fold metallo-hydrolase [Bacteroidota bacterium]